MLENQGRAENLIQSRISPVLVKKIHDRPTSRSHPRRRLTAVPDDEQLKEVIVVPGHAGSWWLTPALCRFFSPFAVRPPRFVGKPHQPPDIKEIDHYRRWKVLATQAGGVFLGVSRRQQSSPSAANSRKLRFLLWWNCTQPGPPGLTAQALATTQQPHPIDESPRTA